MDVPQFEQLIAGISSSIAGQPLDAALAARLNAEYGPGSAAYEALFSACREGVRDGWMCNREGGGIRYGRVLKATDATHGFSVDVVLLSVRRVRPPVPGSTPNSGTSGRLTEEERSSTSRISSQAAANS